ncbi:MAG: glycosyltransferase family 1 protein [Ferruginibacter sp.]|nr:glycosyltransferase family 1 protein [Ferruginibacter sp.]
MIIGFDGKRAFQNRTGLGNYSRSLLTILRQHYPADDYILFAPRQTNLFPLAVEDNVRVIVPTKALHKRFPTLWRRKAMVKEIEEAAPDVYHGLSNELPIGIEKLALKKVVTIHDLIFERFPATYNFDERYVHRWKIKRACKIADAIIAISKQTRDDLVNIYGVAPGKIHTCYQSCNPIFEIEQTVQKKLEVKKRYDLPDKYFLFVSAIAPRKNLLLICQAMAANRTELNLPLVVIGDGKKEKATVKAFMKKAGLSHLLVFLNEKPLAQEDAFTSGNDFPAIYQQALALIYPSLFEGFGLPILEALWSGLPVICTNTSSLPEVAGQAACYFEPGDTFQLAEHMKQIILDPALAADLRNKGFEQAQQFTRDKYARAIMNVYTK